MALSAKYPAISCGAGRTDGASAEDHRGQPTYLRVVMLLLGVPNLVAGGWALATPQGWFDNFPGWAPALVAAYPPFNEHLVVDAGAGLFATGLMMTERRAPISHQP